MRAAPILAALVLAGCQSYTSLPLNAHARLARSASELDVAGADLLRPLGVGDVAQLALRNNPDLQAARAQHGVAQAQLLQASLYPNPSVTGSILPLVAGPAAANPGGSSTFAWGASLSYDIRSLITRGPRVREARMSAREVDANLLWQEWQVAAQARLLAVDIIEGDQALALLERARDLLRQRGTISRAALAQGNATLITIAPDIAAADAAEIAADAQARTQLDKRHQLNALLGLAPNVTLALSPNVELPEIDAASVRADMATLADRRPDLAALRYGYAAQDAKLRAAILSQFPNVSFGITGGSDNSNVRNIGPQITLELPVFDRNQGDIAIQRATRAQLHAEYAARLKAVQGQVGAALAAIAQFDAQLAMLRNSLPSLRRQAAFASSAEQSGNLDERSALDLILAPLSREQDVISLQQLRDEQIVAIATLIGAGLPPLRPVPQEGS